MSHPASAGLRQLADFLDRIADAGAHVGSDILDVSIAVNGSGITEVNSLRIIAAEARTFEKVYTNTLFYIKKDFDRVKVSFYAWRNAVCERVVVGTETIPEQVVPATEETIIPARTVEKVEWRCGKSLLDNVTDELASEAAP